MKTKRAGRTPKVPPQPVAPLSERLKRMEEAGIIEPRTKPQMPLPPPLPLEDGLAQRILAEDRGA